MEGLKLEKFVIEVCRIGYGFHKFEIEAETKEQAEEIALNQAGDFEYSENSSKYEISTVWEF